MWKETNSQTGLILEEFVTILWGGSIVQYEFLLCESYKMYEYSKKAKLNPNPVTKPHQSLVQMQIVQCINKVIHIHTS